MIYNVIEKISLRVLVRTFTITVLTDSMLSHMFSPVNATLIQIKFYI